jgi:hypothetical protein
MFNQRDWEGLRALLADDVKLHQLTHPVRVGAADVGMFFGIYAKIDLLLRKIITALARHGRTINWCGHPLKAFVYASQERCGNVCRARAVCVWP